MSQESPRNPRVDHLQRRQSDSAPRRRKADPVIRRRKEDHKKANTGFGAFVTAAVAVLFLAYVFNFQEFATAADHFFTGLNTAAQSENAEVVSLTKAGLPVLALLLVSLVLFGVVRWVLAGAKKSEKKRKLARRDVITLDRFRELTASRGINARIAIHAYALLLPHYQRHMRVRLDDHLKEDLHLDDTQVQNLLGDLLRSTDRKPRVGTSCEVATVMDLLQCVQSSPRNFLGETSLHPAQIDRKTSVIRPRVIVPIEPSQATSQPSSSRTDQATDALL